MSKNDPWTENDLMPEEIDSESKKNPLLLLLIPLVIIALVLIGVGGVLLARGSQDGGYAKSLEQAELARDEGDMEAAITYYLEAIDEDPSKAEPYLEAAALYEENGQIELAVELLERGVQNTGSARIKNALLYLQRGDQEDTEIELAEKDETSAASVSLNESFLLFVSGAGNRDFNGEFGENTKVLDGGITEVTYTNVPVSCYYNQSPDETTRPAYVAVRDLSYLFPGMGETISFEEIQALPGVTEASATNADGASSVVFNASGCSVKIACDEAGMIRRDSGNQITVLLMTPEDNQAAEEVFCILSGTVIDATTGRGVDATLKFHADGSPNGEVLLETDSASNGEYEAKLIPGEYVIEIEKEGYITEYFAQTMYSWIPSDEADFVISPELAEGQIRIVLEWGATPTDLDSHLIGTASGGQNVHMYFGDSRYTNICELDVDDTDGYGPETTTIYDIHGTYDFVVDDYTDSGMLGMSGATVKIYMPDESAPVIVSVPAGITDNWYVCSIRDGAVTVENREY